MCAGKDEKLDILSLDFAELNNFVTGNLGEKKYRGAQIYDWLHARQADGFDEMTNISKALRERLEGLCEINTPRVEQIQTSKIDGTRKYLFALRDGQMIEAVLMRYRHGLTVCVSSQAGCKMGCKFCASAIGGLVRSLAVSELLGQVYKIQQEIGERVSNVVIMGTGEPLDNYDNVVKFIRMLSDEGGLNISQRNITLSTCGLVPKIYDLAEEGLTITLAVSLHAPSQSKREDIMPIAMKYGMDELIEACKYYFEKTKRRITFEYTLIAGVNDSVDDARELGELLAGMDCHVNLIPVNPVRERKYTPADAKVASTFQKRIEKYVNTVTIRREMGQDIDGACGQLRKRYIDDKLRAD